MLKSFAGHEEINATVVSPISVQGMCGDNSDLCMEDGQPLWPPGSPVHLKAAAYLKIAEEIVQQMVFGSSSDDNASQAKRPQLDSVIVRTKSAVVPAASTVKPGWSAGFLPPGGGSGWRGRGRNNWGAKWHRRHRGGRQGH